MYRELIQTINRAPADESVRKQRLIANKFRFQLLSHAKKLTKKKLSEMEKDYKCFKAYQFVFMEAQENRKNC